MTLALVALVLLTLATLVAIPFAFPKSIDLGLQASTDDLTSLYAEGYYTPVASALKATGGGTSDATATPSIGLWQRIGRTVALRCKVAIDADAGNTDLLSFALSIPAGTLTGAAGVAVAVSATQTAASGAGVTSLDVVVIPNADVDITAAGGSTLTITFPSAVPNGEACDLQIDVHYILADRAA